MRGLLKNIRFYVLVFSFLLLFGESFWVKLAYEGRTLQTIRLTQVYALTALAYLYLALLIGPLTYTFKFLPFRGQIYRARRSIGVSAFFFGLLHGYVAFFKQLGGFEGLGFLSGKYLLAISFSFMALIILTLMAATSFDFMVRKLTFPKWKLLHRFVYLAAVFILIHALMLGTHFADLSQTIPTLFFIAFALLLLLEGLRIDAYFAKKSITLPRVGPIFVVVSIALTWILFTYIMPNGSSQAPSLGIHSLHIQLAKQAQNLNSTSTNSLPNLPGLRGDRTLRFTTSFSHDDIVEPNKDTVLHFEVFNASSGNRVQYFEKIYEKVVHMIVVDSELKYFTHIHPTQDDSGLTITTQFPHSGQYHIYLDFQPLGAIEQQFAFTLNVGEFDKPTFSSQKADINRSKIFGDYQVVLQAVEPLRASDLSVGQQTLKFTVRDAKTKQPVTTLKPYLAAFGHLVMINEKTFDYLHVHPTNLKPPAPNENGGPDVEFLPLGLYGPIKPGKYRVFAQFNPNGTLMVADYTVEVK